MHISRRLIQVPPSPIRKLVPFAIAAKKAGVKVYHLNIGDPDIKTPEVMIDVLKKWEINPIGYCNSQGHPDFLEALKIYYHRIGFPFLDIPNIQVTTGGSEALYFAFFATCNPGDEMIVFEPFFSAYAQLAAISGITLKAVRTTIANGFHLPDQKEIEKKITKKTKAILYTNPNNPTGTNYTKKEIEMLVSIAKNHNLFLLSDEVYREFVFDGQMHVSLLSYMRDIPQQAILLDSMSKRYSLCGTRLGALVSLNKEIMSGVLTLAQTRLSSGLIDQMVAAKLTEVPKRYLTTVHKEYENRRNLLYEGLRKIPGVIVHKPEGAFYMIVELPIKDSEDFCKWLLTDFRDPSTGSGQAETIMLAPASGFYATAGLGKSEVRIAYVIHTKDLKRSIELLQKALAVYPSKSIPE